MHEKPILAVIDTNVIVSALLSHDGESNPSIVLKNVINGKITPLFNDDIMSEYREVLSRDKFPFRHEDVENTLDLFLKEGVKVDTTVSVNETFIDMDDVVFYEVAMSMENACLITGNIKHFPTNPIVITPAEMAALLKE